MEKKKTAVAAVKVASGYYAISRTAGEIKENGGRFWGSIKGTFLKSATPKPVNSGDFKYRVYTPFLFQYGSIVENAGVRNFVPEGQVDDASKIPKNEDGSRKMFFEGAWFVGDDFAEMMDSAFTPEQQTRSIKDYNLRKNLYLIGAATIVALCVLFALFGKIYGLFSLPAAIVLTVFALRNGINAETIKSKSITSIGDYMKKRGILGWLVA